MGRRLRNLLKKKDLMKPIVYSVSLMESDNYDVVPVFITENRFRKQNQYIKISRKRI